MPHYKKMDLLDIQAPGGAQGETLLRPVSLFGEKAELFRWKGRSVSLKRSKRFAEKVEAFC